MDVDGQLTVLNGIVSKTSSVQLQAEWLRIVACKQDAIRAFNLGRQNESRNGFIKAYKVCHT